MCLTPKLTSIPRGEWLCPRCVSDGVTFADLRVVRAQITPQPGPMLRGKPVPLFQDGTHRRLSQELRAFDGRTTVHKTRHGNSGEDSKLGRVAYIGDHAGLKCFKVGFTDGSRRVQRSGDQEPAHARMWKDRSSVVRNQRSVISSSNSGARTAAAAATGGGGCRCGCSQRVDG